MLSMPYVKVFHITELGNLESILKNGIKSRKYGESNSGFVDIADQEVEANHRNVIVDGRSVDLYARCFFNPLPPMFYRRKDEKDLCILELHIPFTTVNKVYDGRNVTFHNMKIDGAMGYPIVLSEGVTWNRWDVKKVTVHNLNKIHWQYGRINDGDNRNDILAKRSAELLVYPEIPAKYISKIYSDSDRLYVAHSNISDLENISRSGKACIVE